MTKYETIADYHLDGYDTNGLEDINQDLLYELKERIKRGHIRQPRYIIATLDGTKPGAQLWDDWHRNHGPDATKESLTKSWLYEFLDNSPLYCKLRYRKDIESDHNKRQLKIQVANRKETLQLVKLDGSHSEANFARFIGTPEEDIHWNQQDKFNQKTLKDGFNLANQFSDEINDDLNTNYEKIVPFSATPTPDGLRRRIQTGKQYAKSLKKFDQLTNGTEGKRILQKKTTPATLTETLIDIYRAFKIDALDRIHNRTQYNSWKATNNETP